MMKDKINELQSLKLNKDKSNDDLIKYAEKRQEVNKERDIKKMQLSDLIELIKEVVEGLK